MFVLLILVERHRGQWLSDRGPRWAELYCAGGGFGGKVPPPTSDLADARPSFNFRSLAFGNKLLPIDGSLLDSKRRHDLPRNRRCWNCARAANVAIAICRRRARTHASAATNARSARLARKACCGASAPIAAAISSRGRSGPQRCWRVIPPRPSASSRRTAARSRAAGVPSSLMVAAFDGFAISLEQKLAMFAERWAAENRRDFQLSRHGGQGQRRVRLLPHADTDRLLLRAEAVFP